jgi:single-stranded-DNA-specific exonuclease
MNKFHNILSAKGKYWKIADSNDAYVQAATQKYGVSNLLAKLLFSKSVLLEEIPGFLDPKLKNLLPDPYTLLDMEKAVNRICSAIESGEKIAIYGDYDVDGASATAILTRYFRALGVEPEIYIPDRMKEGYGINTDALINLQKDGIKLVISVDCGVTAFEPIAEAKKVGLDVVVIDHHLSAETFPVAAAIVNPNRFDDTSGLNNLCASGVSFLLCIALNRKLREKNFFQNKNEPELLNLLDLVALGTVCDVMTLTGVNRAFVSQGLKILAARKNAGLSAIADVAGLNKKPDVYSLGFLIGPRVNASGRIGDCSLGAKILASDDEAFAKENAETLNNLNKERQEIEKKIIAEAIEQAEKQNYKSNPLIMVYSEKWHQGVIGIVAGRLKEMFNKPAAVIAISNNLGKASARSVSGIDFGSAIANAKAQGLLVAGGGHKMAAGFTVEQDKIHELYDFLCQQFEKSYENYANDNSIEAQLSLKVSSLSVELMNEVEKLGPFGNGNYEPTIILEDVKIVKMKVVGERHMQVFISESGLARNSATIKGVCFNCVGRDFGDKIEANLMKNASIMGKMRKNIWNGAENIEFHIDDIVVY